MIVFGDHDQNTLDQFEDVRSRAIDAALMADGHLGYVMPIGGVAAYDDRVSIVGVGFDIACGNAAIRTDLNRDDLADLTAVADEIFDSLSFGLGLSNLHDRAPTDDPLFAVFEGCYDVMGDGSLILLPTPGHTPGSSSLLVRTSQLPPILLIGDLAYNADMLMEDKVPGKGDAKQLRRSYAKVHQLKQQLPELVLVPSHDAAASEAFKSILASI